MEIESYMNEKAKLEEAFQKQKDLFASYVETVAVLQGARGPLDVYMTDMDAEVKTLEAENYEIQQRIRAGRRRFIDAAPQDGVMSVLGLQTADDKALLAFWIAFILGVLVLEFVLLVFFRQNLAFLSIQQKSLLLLAGLIVACVAAFAAIRYFA